MVGARSPQCQFVVVYAEVWSFPVQNTGSRLSEPLSYLGRPPLAREDLASQGHSEHRSEALDVGH